MQSQPTLDQRQHPRRDVNLVVSYQRKGGAAGYGIAQTRNVSQGGMLLTTARAFSPGARLAIRVRLPFERLPRLVEEAAEAVESRAIARGLLYETRVRFLNLNKLSSVILAGFCTGKTKAPAATVQPELYC